jgi:hypothetical protein
MEVGNVGGGGRMEVGNVGGGVQDGSGERRGRGAGWKWGM